MGYFSRRDREMNGNDDIDNVRVVDSERTSGFSNRINVLKDSNWAIDERGYRSMII